MERRKNANKNRIGKIENIRSQKILDSRGNWTIETKVILDDGSFAVQPVPSGASVGENEAVYIDVDKASDFVSTSINDVLVGKDPSDQKFIDSTLAQMDGTHNKGRMGANSILSVSLACARASAISLGMELYQYLSVLYSGKEKNNGDLKFPTPIFNVINGGEHAKNKFSFQEFMVIPALNTPFNKAVQMGVVVYKDLKKLLIEKQLIAALNSENRLGWWRGIFKV